MPSTTNSHTLRAAANRGASAGLPKGERGAAMLAALCFSLVLVIALSSYITMCYRSLQMSTRNANSGRSVELAETGMEEALWALHNNDWSGWTISGKSATKTLSDFTVDGNATGTIRLAIANFDGTTGTRTLTATGTTTLSDGTTQSRTLTSTSSQAPLFINAIAGTTGIVQFKSAGTVDSYDSTTDLNAASVGYQAIVASTSNATASSTVQMTNVQIKGYVATLSTGPSYSTSATLYGPNSPVSPKIDPSRSTTSPYQPIFDEIVPSAPNPLPGGGNVKLGTAGATTPTYYYDTNTNLNRHDTVTVDGPVVLVISGSLSLSGSAQIVVTTNGRLEIHVTGNVAIDGNGILNNSNLPKNVAIFSSSSTATLEMGTTTAFRGVIYAPNAALTISSNQAIYGSLVAKSVTFSGSPVFHYDTSLRTATFAGLDTPYAVSNLIETNRN